MAPPVLTSLSVLCWLALVLAVPAHAASLNAGSYKLSDHGGASAYGLRLAGVSAHAAPSELYFSVDAGGASATLTWDGAGTAVIKGQLARVLSGGGLAAEPLWNVSYTLSGVTPVARFGDVIGFSATGGSVELDDPLGRVSHNAPSSVGPANANRVVFAFLADGHEIPDDWSTPVGRSLQRATDWQVRGSAVVPEPSTGLLGLVSLGIVSMRARSKRNHKQLRSV